jgi:lysophospholipase L1-like esterase
LATCFKAGRNIVAFGDSYIGYSKDTITVYPQLLWNNLNALSLQISGKTLGSSGLYNQSITGQSSYGYQNSPDRWQDNTAGCGLIIFSMGANDSLVASGLTPSDTMLYYGRNLQYIRGKNPYAEIICTSYAGVNPAAGYSAYSTDFKPVIKNIVDNFPNAIWCDFVDGWEDADHAIYTLDGIHPNQAGHNILYGILKTIVMQTHYYKRLLGGFQ